MEPTKYIVYIIKSDRGHYYIGQTKNLEDRLNRHNRNRSKSTKKKRKWELVVSSICDTRSEAMKLERKLKSFRMQKAINYLERIRKEGAVSR